MADETPAQFVSRLERYVVAITNDALTTIVNRVGVESKGIARLEAARDVGPDIAFSNWRPDTNALVTRYDVPHPGVMSFHPTRRAAGPWTVAHRQFGTASRVVDEIEAMAPGVVDQEIRRVTRSFFV
jgi:hypothetical protein